MKHTCKILLLVFCIVFMMSAIPAGAFKECVCLDSNGKAYSKNDPAGSKCYSCADGECTPNGMTLDQCREKPSGDSSASVSAPAVEQPAAPAPAPKAEQPAAPAPAPVVEQPAAPAPVVEQPAAPVSAPVAEQPAAAAPVYEEPAAPVSAPVYEEPAAAAPVYEEPAAPVSAPVYEEPAEYAPVYEEPAAPVFSQIYEEPAEDAPVYEEPAAPVFSPVYEEPAEDAPVYEEPAAPVFTPAYEEPAAQEDLPAADDQEPLPAPALTLILSNTDEDTAPADVSPDDSITIVPVTVSDEPAADPADEEEPVFSPVPVLTTGDNDTDENPENGGEEPAPIPLLVSDEPAADPEAEEGSGETEPSAVPVPVLTEGETEPDQDAEKIDVLPTEESDPAAGGAQDPELTETEEGSDPEITETPGPEAGTEEDQPDLTAEPGPDEEDPELTGTEEADPEAEAEPEVTETPEPEEENEKNTLKSSPVLGDVTDITLSEPNGTTETSSDVTLVWAYSYDNTSAETDVVFSLTLDIVTDSDTVHTEKTISEASCSGVVCSYNASSDLSSFEEASVSWNVSAPGVSSNNGPFSFTLKQTPPTPEPPTPTPVPKPEAPVLECPVGPYQTRDLGFYWAPSKNAETYTVNWKDDKSHSGSFSLSNSDATCQKGRCIAHATMPGVGKYTWTVTAKNASGSAKSKSMSFEIRTNISTPRPYSPNGTIWNNNYPAFEWEDVHDGAVEYRIQVVGKYDNRIRMDSWFRVKDIYVGNGICWVQTDLFLPGGTYCWRVMAKNKSFTSGWSEWRDFTVQYYYVPTTANTVPNVSYPVGTILTPAPDFQWRHLTGAAYYQVKLFDAAGKVLLDNRVPSSNCSNDLCTWKPGYKLPANGNYTWTVSGYGSTGTFWNSSSGSFTLQAPVVMKPMSFLSPVQNGYLSAESPMVIWTDPGEGAVVFSVEIYDQAGSLLFNASLSRAQAWCDGISCAIEFKSIPDAQNYRIRLTPYSEYNESGNAIELVFNKGVQKVIVPLNFPKAGSTVTSRPLFRWSVEAGTDQVYELILTDASNNVMTYSPLICGAEGVNCYEGEAFFSPAAALPAGVYSARVGIQGLGAAGEAVQFSVR